MKNEDNVPGRRKGGEEEDSFMVTYVSLMILLLTFMILMVTLASFKEPRFRKAIGSVKGALSFLPHKGGESMALKGHAGLLPQEMLARGTSEEQEEKTYEENVKKIKAQAEKPEFAGVEVLDIESGIALRIADPLMFDKGKADLKPGILPILDLVAEIVRSKPGKISVVGNTCDLPISTPEFPSNWELSMARALSIVHYLESKGVPPEQLYAYGLADQKPIVPNDSEENRKKNRRVEIYVIESQQNGGV